MQRGFGPSFAESIEDNINKRLEFLRHGEPYTYVREWHDGKVIQTQGARMPDGGFITTFTDITALKVAEHEDAGIAPEIRMQPALALQRHRVRIGEGIDATVQQDALAYRARSGRVDTPLDEIAHQAADDGLFVVTGKVEMGEIVHGCRALGIVMAPA